jgi:hypothetical protein
MGFLKGIGKVFKKVGGFIKKGIGFANKLLNGPLGKIASMIPGIGGFVKGAQMVVGAADGILNKKGGIGAVLKGLAGPLLGKLGGAAGGLLNKVGLGSVGDLLGKATQNGGSSGLLDAVKSFVGGGQLKGATDMLSQGSKFNLQQMVTSNLAKFLGGNNDAAEA